MTFFLLRDCNRLPKKELRKKSPGRKVCRNLLDQCLVVLRTSLLRGLGSLGINKRCVFRNLLLNWGGSSTSSYQEALLYLGFIAASYNPGPSPSRPKLPEP